MQSSVIDKQEGYFQIKAIAQIDSQLAPLLYWVKRAKKGFYELQETRPVSESAELPL